MRRLLPTSATAVIAAVLVAMAATGPMAAVSHAAPSSPTHARATPTEPPPPTCAHPTIVGTPGDDVIVGTDGPDVIDAGAGNDVVYGEGGNDVICGGPGHDRLYGGPGDDLIVGSYGNDIIVGGEGSDTLWGSDGADTMYAGEVSPTTGRDVGDVDTMYGDLGPDTMVMDDGTARMYGGVPQPEGAATFVLRAHPGPGTFLTGRFGTVKVVAPATGPAIEHVSADLGSGRLTVDDTQVTLDRIHRIEVDGAAPQPISVSVRGTPSYDTVILRDVTTADVDTRASGDTIEVWGGSRIQRMDLRMGGGGFLRLLADVGSRQPPSSTSEPGRSRTTDEARCTCEGSRTSRRTRRRAASS